MSTIRFRVIDKAVESAIMSLRSGDIRSAAVSLEKLEAIPEAIYIADFWVAKAALALVELGSTDRVVSLLRQAAYLLESGDKTKGIFLDLATDSIEGAYSRKSKVGLIQKSTDKRYYKQYRNLGIVLTSI